MKTVLLELLVIGGSYGLALLISAVSPLPASLLSMAILFALLATKRIDVTKLNRVTPLFMGHLALFFVAPAVLILEKADLLEGKLIALFGVLVLSNILVMGVTGAVVQAVIRRKA